MAGKLSDGIVYMIAKNRQPLSVVEDRDSKDFCLNIAVRTIATRMDDQYRLLQNKVKTILSNVDNISLTLDIIWTDPFNTKGFICATAHFIDEDNLRLESLDLGMQELEHKHDSAYISKILKDVCQEWGIELTSVRAIVTDNASNMKEGVYDMFGSQKHLPYFAHTLNLMTQDALTATLKLSKVTKKVTVLYVTKTLDV